jgi:hypothetical protein
MKTLSVLTVRSWPFIFRLINISLGIPMVIVKNLRIGGDGHISTKFIFKIVGYEFGVRDAK